MALETKIAWCDATINFWLGCTKVSPACDNCYAEAMATRFDMVAWGHGAARRERLAAAARDAFKLQRRAVKQGRRLRVFSNSMADFFDNEVPDDWRDFAMAVIALTPNLDWLVLTKRPKVARVYMTGERKVMGSETLGSYECVYNAMGDLGKSGFVEPHPYRAAFPEGMPWPLENLWLGVTAENQAMADLRIPDLLATPAALRFVSAEPLLGPVDFARIETRFGSVVNALTGRMVSSNHSGDVQRARLDWVIIGGESGPGARVGDLAHHLAVIEQCRADGVPVFEKQLGAKFRGLYRQGVSSVGKAGQDPAAWPVELQVREFPKSPAEGLGA